MRGLPKASGLPNGARSNERGEKPVLQTDAPGQHAVEELRDRRQFLARGAVLVAQIETGRLLKFEERTAFDFPAWVSW
jgi:hypothetical protein